MLEQLVEADGSYPCLAKLELENLCCDCCDLHKVQHKVVRKFPEELAIDAGQGHKRHCGLGSEAVHQVHASCVGDCHHVTHSEVADQLMSEIEVSGQSEWPCTERD